MEHIRSTSGLSSVVDVLTMIYEDNATYIVQIKKGYIKGDNTKHIEPKFFFSHQQQEYQKIEFKEICSQDYLVDHFTKSLLKFTFQKLVQGSGMCKLSKLNCL
ncbi:hypothetical protein ACFX1S_006921 [Malus domestica]